MRRLLLIIGACAGLGCTESTVEQGQGKQYTGESSGQLVTTISGGRVTCVATAAVTIRMDAELIETAGQVSGHGKATGTETGGPGSPTGCGPAPTRTFESSGDFTVNGSEVRFARTTESGGSYNVITTITFVGTLSGDVINGTVTIAHTGSVTGGDGITIRESSSGTYSLTLRH